MAVNQQPKKTLTPEEIQQIETSVTNTEGYVVKTAKAAAVRLGRRLSKEPLVKVYGAPSYKKALGPYYTFLFNSVPVTIKFDGTWQKYPKPIARHLLKKLEKTSAALTPISKEEKIQ